MTDVLFTGRSGGTQSGVEKYNKTTVVLDDTSGREGSTASQVWVSPLFASSEQTRSA